MRTAPLVLPPPRSPAPRRPVAAAPRPTLVLAEDEDLPLAPPLAGAPGPRAANAGVAGLVVVAAVVAGITAAWFSSRPARVAQEAVPVATTTVNAASVALLPPRAAPRGPALELPAVDVNSLPPAPRRAPDRAPR
ncbi:MAG TPA: hypothetical protein VLT33_41625 [Labilithrix sp.]|nr:hypothetical protein [Labilithrix sp.]